jgi:hypothetical protein
VRAEVSPRVDGVLDDAAWLGAPLASGLRQREPAEGEAATEETEVRVVRPEPLRGISPATATGRGHREDRERDRVITRV